MHTHPPQLAKEPAKLPSVSAGAPSAEDFTGDLLVVGVFEEDIDVTGAAAHMTHIAWHHPTIIDEAVGMKRTTLQQLDSALGGVIADILALGDFKAKVVRTFSGGGCA